MRLKGLSSAPAAQRTLLWISLLVVASVMFSLGFACATPFAAFAAAAAITSSRRDALALILSVWFVNQFVGFTVLGYPWTPSTLAWGAALGAAAALAVLAGQWAASCSPGAGRSVGFLTTFLAAFAVYEAALFAVALLLLGGTEDFTASILGWIFVVNIAAFVALLALHRLAVFLGVATNPAIPFGVTESHA